MMVIGLLVVSGIPTTIGVCEALSAQKKANAAAKEKAKFHLTVTICLDENGPVECPCILKDGKMWIDHPAFPMPGHKFQGWYFMYPSEAQHLGLVSTVSDDPPALGWIFVDKDSHMVRHGSRAETLGGHTIGPWYWSNDEQWLTLEGDDGNFVAVEQENEKWAIAWDGDGKIRSSGEPDETEESEEDDEETGEGGERPKRLQWLPVKLRRRMQLGMESRYVKGQNG
ncbi:hypothetical protein QBC47DRAFT_371392 [Echria macrotheca]|uniref:Uncharacterized protein n=1 Tax=Echria macrotheca TaxID=438768 RepID=A0AAJ0FDE3_9PEZI|nr:hypothetical protein QBC47DRAFT_371392 [Echria macrotheca]